MKGWRGIWAGATGAIVLVVHATASYAVFACGESPDAETLARHAAWDEQRLAALEVMRNSADPRVRALAALTGSFADPDRKRDETAARSAADAVPDDVLVQWIALRRAEFASGNYEPMLSRLKAVEPDNAVIWLEVLERAVYLKDAPRIDDALVRMSQSSRFDDHAAELKSALIEALTHAPASSAATPGGSEADDFASSYASNVINTVAVPVRTSLDAICGADADAGASLDYTADCASIMRLMAKGDGAP